MSNSIYNSISPNLHIVSLSIFGGLDSVIKNTFSLQTENLTDWSIGLICILLKEAASENI